MSRSGSQLGSGDYTKVAEHLAKSQEEDLEKPNLEPNKRLSIASDPCIVTKYNETSDSKKPHSTKLDGIPKFEISPHSSMRENSDSSSHPSNPDTPVVDSMKKRKKARRVVINVPPTPDHKKAETTHFDFSSSSDEP